MRRECLKMAGGGSEPACDTGWPSRDGKRQLRAARARSKRARCDQPPMAGVALGVWEGRQTEVVST
jgi:hypothetical protein